MTDTTTPPTATAATASPADPYALTAAPLRQAFTAAMTPYTSGQTSAPAELTSILMEALTATEPTAELIGMLCHLVTSGEPNTESLSIMHRATGAALGLSLAPNRALAPTRPAAPRPTASVRGTGGATRPGSIGDRIVSVLAQKPGMAFTVTELAREVSSGTGATAAAISGLIGRGEAVLASEDPRRYTAPDLAAPVDTTAQDAPDAPATTSDVETVTVPAEPQATGTPAPPSAPARRKTDRTAQ